MYSYVDRWYKNAEGLRLHYTEWGEPKAPLVVLIHGLYVQCHTWDPIARSLAQTYRVVAPDLRGHGDSDWSRAGYRVRQFSSDVAALIDALGVGPARIVGHSLGVRVAIALADQRPDMVSRMALSDAGPSVTAGGAVDMREWIETVSSIRGFRVLDEVEAFYRTQHPEWVEEFIDLHVQHQVRRNWAGKFVLKADPDCQWITGSISLPDVEYLWRAWERLEVPTLLMMGKRSNLVDHNLVSEMEDRLPSARTVWFDAGHYVPREAPEEFISHLKPFLQEG